MAQTPLSIPISRPKLRSMESFGKLVRRARLAKGMKGADLGSAVGRDGSYISRIENGEQKETPPPDVMAALSSMLDVPEERLLRAWGYLKDSGAPPPGVSAERAALRDLLDDVPESAFPALRETIRWARDANQFRRQRRARQTSPESSQ